MPLRARIAATPLTVLLQDAKKRVASDPDVPVLMSKAIMSAIALQLRKEEFQALSGVQLTYSRLLRAIVPQVLAASRKAYRAISEEGRHLLRVGPDKYLGAAATEISALLLQE